MQEYVIINFKSEKSRNAIIGYMEKYFGNDGMTFAHSLRTNKEPEKIMLQIPSDDNFIGTMKKFRKQGICKYTTMSKPFDFVYKDKTSSILELATETVRLLSSFFGH